MSEEIILKTSSAVAGCGSGSGSIPFADEDVSTVPCVRRRGQSRILDDDELTCCEEIPRRDSALRNDLQGYVGRSVGKSSADGNGPGRCGKSTCSRETTFGPKVVAADRASSRKSRTDNWSVPAAENPLQRYEHALLKYQKPKLRARKQISRENSYGYSSSDDSVIRNKSKSTSSIDTQSVNNILDEYEDLDYRRSSDLSDVGSISVTNFEAVMDMQRQREQSRMLKSPTSPAARNAVPPLPEKLQPLLKVNQQTQVRQRSRERQRELGKPSGSSEDSSVPIPAPLGKKLETESGIKVPVDVLMRKGEVQKRVDEWLSQTQSQNYAGSRDKALVRSNSSTEHRYRNNSNGTRSRSGELEVKDKLNGTSSYDDLNRDDSSRNERKVDKVSVGVNTSRGTYKEYLATRNRSKQQQDYGLIGSSRIPSSGSRDGSPGTCSKIPQRGYSNSSFRSRKSETANEGATENRASSSTFGYRRDRERSNRQSSDSKFSSAMKPDHIRVSSGTSGCPLPCRRPSLKRTQQLHSSVTTSGDVEEESDRSKTRLVQVPRGSNGKGPCSSTDRASRLEETTVPNKDGESQRPPPLLALDAQSHADKADPGKPLVGTLRDERRAKAKIGEKAAAIVPTESDPITCKERYYAAIRSGFSERSCLGRKETKREISAPIGRLEGTYGAIGARVRLLQGQGESTLGEFSTERSQIADKSSIGSKSNVEGRKPLRKADQNQGAGNERDLKCRMINPVSTFKPIDNVAMYATLQTNHQSPFNATATNESVTRSHYATPKHIEKIYERPQPQVIHADDLESILKPVAPTSAYGDKLLSNERKPLLAADDDNNVGRGRCGTNDEDAYGRLPDARYEHLETIVEDLKSEGSESRFPEIGLNQCLKVQQRLPSGKTRERSPMFSESTMCAKSWDQSMIVNDPPKTFSTFQSVNGTDQDGTAKSSRVDRSRALICTIEAPRIDEKKSSVATENLDEVGSTSRSAVDQSSKGDLSILSIGYADLAQVDRFRSRTINDESIGTTDERSNDDTIQLIAVRDSGEREVKCDDVRAPVVNEILVKNLKFEQDVPGVSKSEDTFIVSEPPLIPSKSINFHSVLSDDYIQDVATSLKNTKIYVTKEEMEHQKLMDLLKRGEFEAVKSELERSYTLSTPGGSSPVCCPPCSPPPAPAAYISSARASSRRLGTGGPSSPDRDPLGRLLRFLKAYYRELGTRDPPHLPPWVSPLPLGTLCPAHFQPHLQLVHKSEQEHRLETIRPDQIFAPVRLSDGTVAEAPRRVAVEGGPGSGRTTLCLRLLHHWATQGDGPALAFIVPLRELRGSPLLNYLARELFPRTTALGDAVTQVWRTLHLMEDRVLFVLDGYDECVGGRASLADAVDLLEGRLFPDARILVTCSPNNSPTLSPLVQRRIHLAGLEWPHVERLCVAYFIHNDIAERACEFLEVLNVQPQTIKQLGQHPLGWIMLCSLYQDSGSLPAESSALIQAAVKCIVKRSLDPPIPYNEEIPGHCRKRLEDFGKLSLAALREGRCCYTEAELRTRGGGIEVTRLGFLARGLTFGQRRKPDLYTPIHMAIAEFLAAYYLTSVAQYANILRRELEGLPSGIINHLAGLLGPKTHLILNQLCPLEVPPRAVFSLLKAAGASDGNISAVCRLVGAGPGFGPAPNERPPAPLVHTAPLELDGWARILESPACTLEALEVVFQIERGSDPRYLDDFFEALAGNESVKLVRITSLLGQEFPADEAQRLAGHLKSVLGKKRLNDFELVITCLEESAHDRLECVVNALCRGLSHASAHLARLVLDMNLSGEQVTRVCEALRDCVQVQALHLPHLGCGCEGLASVADLLKERPLLALNLAGSWGAKNEDPSSSGISMGSGSGSGSSGCVSSTLGTLPLNRCYSSLPRGALSAYGSLTRPATLPRLPLGLGLGPSPGTGTGPLPPNDRDRDSNGSSKRNSDSVLCHRLPLLHPLPTCDVPSHQGTGFHEIFNAIREPNCKLRSLNVSKCLLGGLDAGCLGETIRKARNLDALRAAGASRPADVMPLVLALTEAPCLQLLDLASPRLALDDHPSRLLCHALARNGTLKLLSLEGWTFRIEESDSLAVFSELLRCTSVRELSLCNARLHLAVHEGPLARLGRRDDAGAELLRAAPPPACPAIVFLRLAGFQVTVNDRLALRGPLLLPFLAGFTALSELDLSLDKSTIGGSSGSLLFIDDKILQQFFGCLSTYFRNLQSLRINFWRISLEDSDRTMRQIAKQLKLCNLSFLKANGLIVTDSAKKVQMEHIFVQTILTNLQYLTWLCLDGVDLAETQASSLGKCVRDRYPGTSLEISAKDINVKAIKALVAAVEDGGRAEVVYTGGSNCRLKITKIQKNGKNKKK